MYFIVCRCSVVLWFCLVAARARVGRISDSVCVICVRISYAHLNSLDCCSFFFSKCVWCYMEFACERLLYLSGLCKYIYLNVIDRVDVEIV